VKQITVLAASVLLLVCADAGAADASAPASWVVTDAIVGSPLRQASLSGQGKVGKAVFPVALTLTCRADQPVMHLTLEVPDSIPGWDVAPFEGPQGMGQRRSMLSVLMKGSRYVSTYRTSGWHSDGGHFNFGWTPDEAFLERVPVTGTHLLVKIEPAKRIYKELEARFDFPSDASAMLAAMSSCRAEGK